MNIINFSECPFDGVASEHGDLIDKTSVMKMLEHLENSHDPYCSGIATAIKRAIDELPIIIKAEIKEKK